MTSLRQTPLTCNGHTRPVVHLSFSDITQYGYFLISACKDGKPMLRQGETGDWIGTFEGHKGAVWAATLNRDATKAATGAADFTAKVWDAVTGNEVQSFAHKHIVKSVEFSGDSEKLLSGSNEKLLKIYDLNKPDADPELFSGHAGNIRCCLWSLDSSKIISASEDKTVRVWDVHNKTEINKLEFAAPVADLELSKDSEILSLAYGSHVSFLNAESFETVKEYDLPSQVNSASLHPEKTSFVCGGEDFKMYRLDYESGKEIESFKGHFGPVHCVRFSPDGELYASGSEDGTLRLWQTTIGKTYGLWKCVQPDEALPTIENLAIKTEA